MGPFSSWRAREAARPGPSSIAWRAWWRWVVSPAAILLLTFTRRAAQEMLRRASALVEGCDRVAGGTFHSFSNTVLRQYARILAMDPNFTILDRSDSEDVINLLRSGLGFDTKERRFPRKRVIGEIFSMAVNRGEALSELLESSLRPSPRVR